MSPLTARSKDVRYKWRRVHSVRYIHDERYLSGYEESGNTRRLGLRAGTIDLGGTALKCKGGLQKQFALVGVTLRSIKGGEKTFDTYGTEDPSR